MITRLAGGCGGPATGAAAAGLGTPGAAGAGLCSVPEVVLPKEVLLVLSGAAACVSGLPAVAAGTGALVTAEGAGAGADGAETTAFGGASAGDAWAG